MDNSLLTMVAVMIIIIEIISNIIIMRIASIIRIMLLNELSRVLIMTTLEEEIIFLRITEMIQELSRISNIGTLIYYTLLNLKIKLDTFCHQQETSALLCLLKELLLFRQLFRRDKLVDREAEFQRQHQQQEELMLHRGQEEEEMLGLNKLSCQREQVDDNDEILF